MKRGIWLCLTLLLLSAVAFGEGEVYLVLGSDTAIWDGMDVDKYHPTYHLSLFTDPGMNTCAVVNPAFRSRFVDSYGQTMKMTWWMMAGNIFRYATNTDVPVPNIMTLYLMKKYHGDAIRACGDELTLHYHTFEWYDYGGTGIFYWNQAMSFEPCRADFDVTLAEFLLEENVFPVSFRSGWHYMDNGWQLYLNTLVPFAMHNDYGNVHRDTIPPIDNDYDWSHAPSAFVPYHPSDTNYQVPGNGKGWNVRCRYMGSTSQNDMDGIFAQAAAGKDQVACLWAHLPEEDFPHNMARIDSLAHVSAAKYPNVRFRYCTAVEAMQRWLRSADTTAPTIGVTENAIGDSIYYSIETNEPIFQSVPFVASKDLYEDYRVIPCVQMGPHSWETATRVYAPTAAKVGIAVTDTVGNLSTKFIRYLPDDEYADDADSGYRELSGNWAPSTDKAWGTTARVAALQESDTARAEWTLSVPQTTRYNFFIQFPSTLPPAEHLSAVIRQGATEDTVALAAPAASHTWIYLGTANLSAPGIVSVELIAAGSSGKTVCVGADVVKLSPLVRERELVADDHFDLGTVSEGDSLTLALHVANHGTATLTITGLSLPSSHYTTPAEFPIPIPPMGSAAIPLHFVSDVIGAVADTLSLSSDDPRTPAFTIPVKGSVAPFFVVADNEDSLKYAEEGPWHYSVAQAYGPTSRFSYLSDPPGAYAVFTTTVKRSGTYGVFEIVPVTVNAADKALYVIAANGVRVDSLYLDQNPGSGNWIRIGGYAFAAGSTVTVKVMNTGASTNKGNVLRADAVKVALEEATTVAGAMNAVPASFELSQNYPNPFNPATRIRYGLPERSRVRLAIYDLLGRIVTTLAEGVEDAGYHERVWNAAASSGMYLYRLEAYPLSGHPAPTIVTRKMLLLR